VLTAIVGDDRRGIVEGAEIETRARILLNVDLVSQPPGLLPCIFAYFAFIFDLVGNRPAAANLGLGMRTSRSVKPDA